MGERWDAWILLFAIGGTLLTAWGIADAEGVVPDQLLGPSFDHPVMFLVATVFYVLAVGLYLAQESGLRRRG